MSGQPIDLNAALGQSYEYRDRTVLPAGYYPVNLRVISTGLSVAKMVDARDDAGNLMRDETGAVVQEEGGNAPYVELEAMVYDGPFAGTSITRKAHIVPGKKGGALGRWLGAADAITRSKPSVGAIALKFGIPLPAVTPPLVGRETPEQAGQRAVRQAIAEGFYALEPSARLSFITTLLMVPAWDGRKAIAKLSMETRWLPPQGSGGRAYSDAEYVKLPPTVQQTLKAMSNNDFAGFLPLDHKEHGLAFCKAIEFPRQEKVLAQMMGTPSA